MTPDRPIQVERLEPGLRRVLAKNPSPMTHWGTNTYLVGEGQVAVIDPGPANADHLQSILDALAPGETVSHVFVTHSHLDHSPLARPLADATGAPVLAFGDSKAGRSPIMERLASKGLVGGGEGVDPHFSPDELLADGQEVVHGDWALTSLWTPGHFGNHLSFAWGDAVFTGDHIMEWSSSLVSPPDGDLTSFMTSTETLAARHDRVFYPGHGTPVSQPRERAEWLLDHRRNREAAILTALGKGPARVPELTAAVYTEIPNTMVPAAERNVFAHLIDLVNKFRVEAEPELALDAYFHLM